MGGAAELAVGQFGQPALDYVVKPFRLPELLARIGAAMRRIQPDHPGDHPDLAVPTTAKSIERGSLVIKPRHPRGVAG